VASVTSTNVDGDMVSWNMPASARAHKNLATLMSSTKLVWTVQPAWQRGVYYTSLDALRILQNHNNASVR
jgi:hypothetical protein